ncbi:amidohydrolase [Nonomuraea sp. NPDC050536]|uniref:amidohydrolase n=1 Tax=Nonomuraea sp. NPDC050536 TaxID=3364366 RepID=UPI0037CAD3E2
MFDLVVRHARIHTVDPARPWVQALAVQDGRIAWVGADEDRPRAAEEIDAGGRLVLPGFVDAHNHVRLGSDDDCVQLAGASSLEEVGRRIADWRARHPSAEWIECEGFDYSALPGLPTAADLDRVTGDVPAFVFSYDVHTMWLNSAGLVKLGVAGGELPFGVARTDASGRPTGFVTEFAVRGLARDGQRALAERGLPWAGEERRYRRLLASLEMATRYGITTVVEPQNSLDDLALFERARAEGRMRSRVIAALFHPRGTSDADLQDFAAAARTDPWFSVGPLKLYIDDVVEPHTAALLEPYAGHAHRGETFYPPQEFAGLLAKLDAAGFQAFVHATGDRGIRTVLDAVEHAREVNGPRDARHQIVHVECLDPADVPRFAELGVVACMQPRHSSPDIAGPGHDWAAAVGSSRWPKAWPMRSLEEAGAVLAFSSDWNVAEMDPMIGIYTAVTRRGLAGGPAWMPAEAVSLETAIRAYTLGSAYANFRDHDRGSITPGKFADLVILSDNLFEIPAERIPEVRAETVIVDGAVT